MSDDRLPLDDLKELAEQEMADKRDEFGDEDQARELYDVVSESPATLVHQQDEGDGGNNS